ncbi:MAG TPA: hypothetical protein GXX25_12045 [Desulfotomaculum sp.]|nr:hypothetical protein [Desulfotomaculum sp.]
MKDTSCNLEIIELFLKSSLPGDRHRQKVIGRVTAKLLTAGYGLGEALSLFFWELADLEPPVSHEEQLFFRALYRTFHTICGVQIDNGETALEILKIPGEKLDLAQKDLLKEVKLAYWKQFNELTRESPNLLVNARKMIIAKKAFDFLRTHLQAGRF